MTTDEVAELRWTDLPREAKLIVYESLRQALAEHLRGAAEAALWGAFAKEKNPQEMVHVMASQAFDLAIEALEAQDQEVCPDCHGYHEDTVDHHFNTLKSPKDVS